MSNWKGGVVTEGPSDYYIRDFINDNMLLLITAISHVVCFSKVS